MTDPRDGGCPKCGRETTPVAISDLLEDGVGQLCPVDGLVHAEARR